MEALDGLEQSLTELRQTFTSGRTRDVAWRKAQLRAILKLIDDNDAKINLALHQDLGKHPVEIYRDEGRIPLLFFPSRGEVLPEPYGLVLIFVSWNFPISLALDPLIGVISGGNTVVLDNIQKSIEFINSRPKPLAIYAFSKDGEIQEADFDGIIIRKSNI